MNDSKFLNLSWKDFKKGVITATLVGAFAVIMPALSAGTIFSLVVLKAAGIGAATGLLGYLGKNILSNSNGNFLTNEPK